MDLLVFAHKGEAQAFLQRGNLLKTGIIPGLSVSDRLNAYVLITGEGLERAGTDTHDTIEALRLQLSRVINLGVAGGLNRDSGIQLGDVVTVKRVIREAQELPALETPDTAGLSCVSAEARVLDDASAAALRGRADVVDRESWAIGKEALAAGIPFYVRKFVSDWAGSTAETGDVRAIADQASQALFREWLTLMPAKMKDQFKLC